MLLAKPVQLGEPVAAGQYGGFVQGPEPALVAPRLEDERGGEIVQQLRLEQHEPTPVGRAQQVHEAV